MIFQNGHLDTFGEHTQGNEELGRLVYSLINNPEGARFYEWLTSFSGVDSYEFEQQPTREDILVAEGRRQVWAAVGYLYGLGDSIRKRGTE